MDIGERLKAERQKRDYSQAQLADKLNISRQAISKWESGKTYPDIDNLKLLSKLYNISADELIGTDCIDQEKVQDKVKDKEITSSTLMEILLVISVVVSCLLPFAGIIVSLWGLFKKGKRPIITIICIICLLTNIYSTVIIVNNLFFKEGIATVTPV